MFSLMVFSLFGCSVKSSHTLPERPPVHHEFKLSVTPDREEYASGELVRVKVTMNNLSIETFRTKDNAIPRLVIGPIMTSLDESKGIPIQSLMGRTIKPGEIVTEEVIIWKQQAQPGWHWIELNGFEFQVGQHNIGVNGAGRFFVKYPFDKVLVKTIEPRTKVTLPDCTLTIQRIEFAERQTKVYFHISNLEPPAGWFNPVLIRSNGKKDASPFDSGQRESKQGGIDGWLVFNPTTKDTHSITLEIPQWSVVHKGKGVEDIKGPWKLEIPIN